MKFLKILPFLWLFLQPLNGSEIQYVKEQFQQKIDTVVAIVSDTALTKEERNSQIVAVLEPIFDFELMAKLSLGKRWNLLLREDQNRFVTLYVNRMKNSYSSKLDSYSGEKIEITTIEQPKNNRIVLQSNLVSQETTLRVDYMFHKPPKPIKQKLRWVIYDVMIQGVSILKTDRAQFSEYLRQNSIEQLMTLLEK